MYSFFLLLHFKKIEILVFLLIFKHSYQAITGFFKSSDFFNVLTLHGRLYKDLQDVRKYYQ